MKHKLYNRLLSLALALGLVVGMLPGMTFAGAVDTTAPQSQAEQIAEPTEEPETVSEESSQAEATPTPAPESSQVEETPAPSQEPEDTESTFIPPVNYTNVAPLTDLNAQRAQMMMANAISPMEGEETVPDGLEISKNIYWDEEENTYKIKLEAYTTGDITVSGGDVVPADIVLVLDTSGSMDDCLVCGDAEYSGFILPVHHDRTHNHSFVRRMDALKEAADDFIDSVYESARDDDVDHRIAIVSFDSSASVEDNLTYVIDPNTGANRTQVLKNTIDGLEAGGATRIDSGLTQVNNRIFTNSFSENRNRIVIAFTDGEPTSGNSFEAGVANAAISQAYTLKHQKGATIYSVGVFSGADGSNPGNLPNNDRDGRANRFMHLISSNYLNAQSMSIPGTLNPSVQDSDDSYYLSAGDQETLNKIFEKISDEVQGGGSSFPLGSDAVIKDVMSDYFEVATDNPNEIEVSYEVPTSFDVDGNVTAWTPDTSGYAPAIAKTFHENKSGIDVSGFDFNHNFVSETGRTEGDVTKPGDFHGRKIVITFPIEVKDGFLGGNNVPTNDSASGIYQNVDAEEPIGRFNVPNLNEEIEDYTLEGHDKTIHLTTSTDANGLFSSSLDPDGWNNDYVNIVYTVKNGDTVVGTYTIKAGETAGTWTGITDGKLNPEDCTDYTITCTVSPITNNPDSVSNQPVSAVPKTTTDPATVHVLKPTITWKDSTQNSGTQITDELLKSHQVGTVTWGDEKNDGAGRPVTQEPTLTYEFSTATGEQISGPINAELHVKVDVKVGETPITDETTFNWVRDAECPGSCTDPNEETPKYQFRIHVGNGDLTIVKQISGGAGSYDNAVFDFKIEAENGMVYYIHLDASSGEAQDTINLPSGTYTVTELDNLNYTPVGKKVQEVTVGGDDVTVTFTNNSTPTKIPSDSGATQNNPDWAQNGIVTWNKDDDIVDGDVKDDYPNTSN